MYYNGFTESTMHGYKEETLKSTISVFVQSIGCYFPPTEKEKKSGFKFPSSLKETTGKNAEMTNTLQF